MGWKAGLIRGPLEGRGVLEEEGMGEKLSDMTETRPPRSCERPRPSVLVPAATAVDLLLLAFEPLPDAAAFLA